MPKYLVGIREVHINTVEVELSEKEAALPTYSKLEIIKILAEQERSEGKELMTEYSHDMPLDHWSIGKIVNGTLKNDA
jgi:hypothetical protein